MAQKGDRTMISFKEMLKDEEVIYPSLLLSVFTAFLGIGLFDNAAFLGIGLIDNAWLLLIFYVVSFFILTFLFSLIEESHKNRISGKRKVMVLLGLSTVWTTLFGTGMSILTGNKLWLIYVFIISFVGFTFLFSLTEESHDEL